MRLRASDTTGGFRSLYLRQCCSCRGVATPFIPLSDFDIFGARMGVDIDKMQFALFVRNFTDQEVQVLKFLQAGYPLSVRWNKPRTYGLSVSYNG